MIKIVICYPVMLRTHVTTLTYLAYGTSLICYTTPEVSLLCVIIASFLSSVEKILQIIYINMCIYYLYLYIFRFIDF